MHAARTLTFAGLLLASTAALAQMTSAPQGTEARFNDLDRDNDDSLTLEEFAAESRARFDTIDIDHNLSITTEEMTTADAQADGELSSAQKIALIDGNEDGVLSIDEHRATVEVQFQAIDANDNERIELEELKSGAPVPVPQP